MNKVLHVLVKTGPLEGHKYIAKSDASILIGRSEEANIRIGYDQYCSRRHASIYWGKDGKCYIQDYDSTNGTNINGKRIMGTSQLNNNDVIGLGQTELIATIINMDESTQNKAEDDISYEE